MIKNNTYKLVLLIIISILLYGLAFIVKNNETDKGNYSINVNYTQNTLHKEEVKLENLILDIKREILSEKDTSKLNRNWFFKTLNNSIENKFTILIFKNDSLKYWSNNTTPAPQYLKILHIKNNSVVKLKNGWYEVIKYKVNGLKIIGLLKIKNNYYYDNQYLQSNFTIKINLPASVIISTTPMIIGKDIYNNKGKYIFSLIPPINTEISENQSQVPFTLFFLAIVFLLFFTNTIIKQIVEIKHSYLFSSIITITLGLILYFIAQKTNFIFLNYNIQLFNNSSKFKQFLSLKEMLIASTYIVFISINIFRLIPIEEFAEKKIKNNKPYIYLFTSVFILIIFVYFTHISSFISSFTKNSNVLIDIRDMLNINKTTIPAYIFISLLFFSYLYILDLFVRLSSRITDIKTILISSSIIFSITIFLVSLNVLESDFIQITFFYLLLLTIIFIRFVKQDYSYFTLILSIFIFTVFFVIFEDKNIKDKDFAFENKLIKNLTNERDDMAERFLKEINDRLTNDTVLTNKIIDVSYEQDTKIINYLLRKYFYGFWEKYDLSVSLCGNSEFYNSENQANNCKGYYLNRFDEFGEKVQNTNFWFINDNSGKITYTGLIEVPIKKDSRNLRLYISLYEKLVSKRLGFPKLLIDKTSISKTEYNGYSYAKYKDGNLTVKSGNYSYDLTDIDFIKSNKKKFFIEKNGFKHLVFQDKSGQKIVLSKEKEEIFDLIISFAYLFVFFNILVFLSIIFTDYRFAFKKFKFDFTNQIKLAMVFILILSFLVFGSGTIYFTIKQDKKVTKKEVADKVQSVLVELKHKLQDEEVLTPEWHTDKYDHLDELLIKFSKVFFSDINLYDLDGHLLATSRSNIFNKGLIGKQMNSKAFKMMSVVKKTEFIHKERIGNLEFLSIYIPLENENNKVIAYINLPYFTKNDDLQNKISNVFIAIINLYLVLFLITIFIAFIISTEISRPLRMLQSKFKAVQLGKKHKEIIYNKNDEIGALVKEYNLMVSKLETSAKKLAESERESAWREMAKQIAHEIKNPLTPMKLSIQFLQKSWYDKIEDEHNFENRLNTVSETLIEQINTLSTIASEFSAFAKMPKTRKEEVDIVKKLSTVAQLFKNTKNVDINLALNKIETLEIIADNEQISRVFINLIKNSIQAIPEKRKGKIKILLKKSVTKATIIIEDNGNGIPDDKKERLFEPSFTTKTTGMGIGLAIVKNIVTSVGGDIWFESKINKGTRFYVEFLRI